MIIKKDNVNKLIHVYNVLITRMCKTTRNNLGVNNETIKNYTCL